MKPTILAEQKALKAAGFDPGPLDGIDGPRTRAARAAFAASKKAPSAHWVPDARSVGNIATLLPEVQKLATEFLRRCHAAGLNFKITSALRTWEEQDALYAQGRTASGKRVTNARGGYSNHNFGLAFDVTQFATDNRTPIWDGSTYDQAAPIGKALGLEWGGDWKSPVDKPHYQFRPTWAKGYSESAMLTGLRERKLKNLPLLA